MSRDSKTATAVDMTSIESKDPDTEKLWRIPFVCTHCKTVFGCSVTTTHCPNDLCRREIYGDGVLQTFWRVLSDEGAWREYQKTKAKETPEAETSL